MSFLLTARLAVLVAVVATVGCATRFKETHFFQSIDQATNRPTNYYRLKVSGYGAMSSTRFVSGYYDERAVDLFFNEVKVAPTADGANGTQTIFVDNQKSPGSTDIIKPLDPTTQHGAFVMILSTNASSVSRTIGQFAENQVVADAITNLANRDVLLRDAASVRAQTARSNATADELIKLMGRVPSGPTPARDETERALLRVLNTIGTGLSGVPTAFDSLDEAGLWLAQSAALGATP